MTTPQRQVSKLEPRDVAAAVRLSTQAGWNQLEADWLRLMNLWPHACFALRDDHGDVIGTSTLASYTDGGVGWLGMVLVDENRRGQGLGGAVFGAALAAGAALECVGLDATDLGLPVYAKHGFVPQVAINRWGGCSMLTTQTAARPVLESDWPAILALDRGASGVDRSALLRAMAQERGARVYAVDDDAGRLDGFGFARRGRVAGHVGPLVANSLTAAEDLTVALCTDRCFIDVLGTVDAGFTRWLTGSGFTVLRRLTRMARPQREAPLLAGPRVFATAALELG